jgi:hypothetical protein
MIDHVHAADPVQVIIVADGAYGAADAPGGYALTLQQESAAAAAVLGCVPDCYR